MTTTEPWAKAKPEEAGFSADLGRKLSAGIASGLLRGLHAVLVYRTGHLCLERYYEGVDEAWGRPLGHVRFARDTLHDLRSVTKSVVSLLYGIALERGLVPALDASLVAQFPEYPDLAADPARARLTIAQALTMTLGLEWDEDRPYTDPKNSEIAMERAADRNRFALDRPIVAEPGTRWIYSGGSVALIGTLISRGIGKTLDAFAREALFAPLGISCFEWARGEDGTPSAASGLRLAPRDLLKLGLLTLGKGAYQGRRIVSAEWIAQSFAPQIATGDGLNYGQLWFLGQTAPPAFNRPLAWAGGFGNGGQRLWVMPEADLALVIFSGHYNQPDSWVTPMRIWREIVVANLVKR
jgi:CubicO group peptidase (beta-lactamase class C family)